MKMVMEGEWGKNMIVIITRIITMAMNRTNQIKHVAVIMTMIKTIMMTGSSWLR